MCGRMTDMEPGEAPEYEQALLVARLDELAGEVREIRRQVRSLDDRVARVAEGYDGTSSRVSSAWTRSST